MWQESKLCVLLHALHHVCSSALTIVMEWLAHIQPILRETHYQVASLSAPQRNFGLWRNAAQNHPATDINHRSKTKQCLHSDQDGDLLRIQSKHAQEQRLGPNLLRHKDVAAAHLNSAISKPERFAG